MAKKKTNKKKDDVESQELSISDVSNTSVKKMIKAAKAEGLVNFKDLNKVIKSEKYTSEQIEDLMSLLSEMGISVVESEDQDDGAVAEKADEKPVKATSTDRTDDQ